MPPSPGAAAEAPSELSVPASSSKRARCRFDTFVDVIRFRAENQAEQRAVTFLVRRSITSGRF